MVIKMVAGALNKHKSEAQFIRLVDVSATGADILSWAARNKTLINEMLVDAPALLFRGFGAISEKEFSSFCNTFSEPLAYIYQSTPRTNLNNGVYTATEYPATASIQQHCENAYQRTWPMKLFFFCEMAAASGGETPIGDVRRITSGIPLEIIEKFREKKVMYVRNYRPGMDIPWQTVFQTNEKKLVERYCDQHDISFTWLDDETLRTKQVCQGTAFHPVTKEEVWFNQAHLFHISSLDSVVSDTLLKMYSEGGVPRNAFYGDGTPIEFEVLSKIRSAFSQNTHTFNWRDGDILLIDNMLCSHGRNPYSGNRRVLVSMGM